MRFRFWFFKFIGSVLILGSTFVTGYFVEKINDKIADIVKN
tara:strand:+ start:228 stop:350 length:123 start_codon:yes stop_codon:yes gene_type:complete